MTYEKFSELWDMYLGKRQIKSGMSNDTLIALIEYSNGNKSKFKAIRKYLNSTVG